MALRALALVFSIAAAAPAPAPTAASAAEPAGVSQAAPAPSQELPEAMTRSAVRAGLTQEMAAKMSGDQIHDLLRRQGRDEVPAIAYVATIGSFVLVLTIVGLALYRGHLKDQAKQATLRLIIERGGQIPPELISPPHKPVSDLKWGILLLSFGIGLSAFIALVAGTGWAVGLLPISVGVGYLVVWALGRNERMARAS